MITMRNLRNIILVIILSLFIYPFSAFAVDQIYVSALEENGTKFIAPSTGVYRFKIIEGAYENTPPQSQPEHPEWWGWQTRIIIYKNRSIQYSEQNPFGHMSPEKWDYVVGDAVSKPSYIEAENSGKGKYIDIPLQANDYLILACYDAKDCFHDNAGVVTLSVNIIKKTVILLHGIWDDGPNCWNKSGVDKLLLDNDFNIYTFNFCPNNGSIIDDAHQLAEKVISLVSLYPGVEINIVSHSKGGLVARYYLAHQELWPIDEYGVPRHGIKKLITLGTPHLGTDIHLLHPIASNTIEFKLQHGNPCTGYQCENEYRDYDYGTQFYHFMWWSTGLQQMTAQWKPTKGWKQEVMKNYERLIPDYFINLNPDIDPNPEEWLKLMELFPPYQKKEYLIQHKTYYNNMIRSYATQTYNGKLVSSFLYDININKIPQDIEYFLFAGGNRKSWESIWCLPKIVPVIGDYEDGVVPKNSALGIGLPFLKVKRYYITGAYHAELPIKTKSQILNILLGNVKVK